ncbi:MAG: serine/threonine-protein kinase [Nannocystales bacterium]
MEDLRICEELGAGAVATVFRVEDSAGKAFAGKVLHASRRGEEDAASRFAREAEVVRAVEHTNVVRVHGRVDVGGEDVLLMELVEGPTLQHVIASDAPLATARVIALGLGIARGLAAAHDAGVIHRDLKPANILLAPGDVPKIADFGMARAASLAGVDRSALTVLGTPDYMAPESLDPLAVDARSDLYGLGCILFELAVGHPPFSGATSFGVLEQHRTAPVPPMPSVDPALAALISQLLEKTPADRVQSASAVADLLEGLQRGETAMVVSASALDLGRCAQCGAPLVDALRICLSCQTPVPRLVDGEHTVFVTGPGEVASKLDSKLRAVLVAWLRDNPTLGIEARKLEKTIPRLPFVLLNGVDSAGADQLVGALKTLGLDAVVHQGGAMALPAARKKAVVLGGRVAGIVAVSFVSMVNTMIDSPMLLLILPVLLLIGPAVTALQTLRPKAKRVGGGSALPPALSSRMDAVSTVAAGMESQRHREALRGVVSRVLALREATGGDGSLDTEATAAIDQAVVAAGRLDTIDRQLERADLQRPTDDVHALMHERDTWSARLLDLVGTLEALRVRLAAAKGQGAASEDTLATLRAKVDALEEVQRDV